MVADAPHAPYLEMGTRPHRPPLQPLIEWAQRKFGVEEDEAKRIAWAVASKIAKVGTEPRLYMARTVDDLEGSIVLQEIEAELKKLP